MRETAKPGQRLVLLPCYKAGNANEYVIKGGKQTGSLSLARSLFRPFGEGISTSVSISPSASSSTE